MIGFKDGEDLKIVSKMFFLWKCQRFWIEVILKEKIEQKKIEVNYK